MPWKPIKGSILNMPSRQDIVIIISVAVIAVAIIGYFAISS